MEFLVPGFSPVWSPDQSKIAFVWGGNIYVIELKSGNINQLTAWGDCVSATWSPDGKMIAFSKSFTNESGMGGIWIMQSNGESKMHISRGSSPDWSPDGEKFVFVRSAESAGPGEAGQGIWVVSIDENEPFQLTERNLTNRSPRWSPDGKKIAWQSSGKGIDNPNSGIWVMDEDGSNQRQLTHRENAPFTDARHPSWSPDGEYIVYSGYNHDIHTYTLWIVDIEGTNDRQLTLPH